MHPDRTALFWYRQRDLQRGKLGGFDFIANLLKEKSCTLTEIVDEVAAYYKVSVAEALPLATVKMGTLIDSQWIIPNPEQAHETQWSEIRWIYTLGEGDDSEDNDD